jgi:xylulose-5-phosphate/fructose-6-phosphate phosphoketolase
MTQLASMGGDTSADNQADGNGETRDPQPYELHDQEGPLRPDELAAVDAWWRAANYLSVGQIYLLDNPLLRTPLQPDHVKQAMAHARLKARAWTRDHGLDIPAVSDWAWPS